MALPKLRTRLFPSAARFLGTSLAALAFCAASAVCVHAQDTQKSSDDSWSKTTETAVANANPNRVTESHNKSGNRTVDTRRVEQLSPNGSYQPSLETETETVQVDADTTRTIVRTYHWDANGRRTLANVSEEDARANASGTHIERKTSSADLNGNFQVVQREVADTKKVGENAEETKSTVYRSDGYGGLAQSEQTQEVKTRGADDTISVQKTTRMPDGNGNWKISNQTEQTIKDDGKERTIEERNSRQDLEGRLYENSRTVSKETETPSGEKKKTVESYSISGSGYTDPGMHLDKRVTTVQKKDSEGEVTEQTFEQPNPVSPNDGPKVTAKAKYVVKYASPGTERSSTVEVRNVSGNFDVISTQSEQSTQPPPSQAPSQPAAQPPAPAPEKKSPPPPPPPPPPKP